MNPPQYRAQTPQDYLTPPQRREQPQPQVTGKEGWAPDWQSSIPTAYQARQNIINNQRAKSQGFSGYSQMGGYQNLLNALKGYSNNYNQPGYGQTSTGMWGPTGGTNAANPAFQQQLQQRLNQLLQFYQSNPGVYQNAQNNRINYF